MTSQETMRHLARSLWLRRLVLTALLVLALLGPLLTGRVHGAEVHDAEGVDPPPERTIRRFGTARYRHGEPIVGLAVSSDDRLAVAFGRSQGSSHRLPSARIYDLRDGRRLAKLSGPVERYNSIEGVAISPDGKTIATKHNRGINLHDPRTGVEIDKIPVSTGNPRSVTYWLTFSPDGSKIAMSTGWQELQIIDVKTKKRLHKFRHDNTVYAGVFSPDGKLFAAGENYSVRLWDVSTGKEVRRLPNGNARMNTLAFSPDGKTLAGGGGAPAGDGGDGQLRLWNVATGKVDHLFEKNGGRIRSVAFAHDGKTIAAAGETIRLYDVATKKERLRIPRRASDLHFSASDEAITASVEGAIHRWETKTGKFLTPQGSDSGVDQIGLANKGRTLVTRDQAGGVHLWDRATGEHVDRLKMEDRHEVGVSPNGRYLTLSVDDPSIKYVDPKQDIGIIGGNKLKLYDLESRRYVERFGGFEGDPRDMQFTRDGKTLVTVDHRNGQARMWDVATGKERRSCFVLPEEEVSIPYRVTGSELSPDDKTLAVACRRRNNPDGTSDLVTLRLWDVTTGKELAPLSGHANNISGLAFSPDGRLLASCTESPSGARSVANAFFIWDVKTGRQLIRLSDRESVSAYCVAFSPDGRTLASASLDGKVHVWEVASWTLRTKFQAHCDHITALHFAPDGTLFTGSFDSTVLAWNIRPDKSDKDLPLPEAWTKLLDPNAETAYAIQGRLLATPKETVALLSRHLRPAAKIDAGRITKLLSDLDNDDFATREAASSALRKLGHQIEPTLRETLAKTTSREVRSRVETLLSQLEPTVASPAQLRTLRAVEVLEWLATPSARELLSKLAKGEPNALLTRTSASAVERLRVREE